MFRFISGKKLRRVEQAVWDKAFSMGVRVGFDLAKAIVDDTHTGIVTGRMTYSQVAKEIDKILKKEGF